MPAGGAFVEPGFFFLRGFGEEPDDFMGFFAVFFLPDGFGDDAADELFDGGGVVLRGPPCYVHEGRGDERLGSDEAADGFEAARPCVLRLGDFEDGSRGGVVAEGISTRQPGRMPSMPAGMA